MLHICCNNYVQNTILKPYYIWYTVFSMSPILPRAILLDRLSTKPNFLEQELRKDWALEQVRGTYLNFSLKLVCMSNIYTACIRPKKIKDFLFGLWNVTFFGQFEIYWIRGCGAGEGDQIKLTY